jgi:hypothetical protein
MRCPCLSAGNTRDHGVMCHYAGMTDIQCTPLAASGGVAIVLFHDRRLCVAVCQAHFDWRKTTSRAFGHSATCPEAT